MTFKKRHMAAGLAATLASFAVCVVAEAGGPGAIGTAIAQYFQGGTTGQLWTQTSTGTPAWTAAPAFTGGTLSSALSFGTGIGTSGNLIGPTDQDFYLVPRGTGGIFKLGPQPANTTQIFTSGVMAGFTDDTVTGLFRANSVGAYTFTSGSASATPDLYLSRAGANSLNVGSSVGNASGTVNAAVGSFSGNVSGTWNGSAVSVAKGGTGLTATPTDGQLLVGKTSTNAYVQATLTGTANQVVVTNGSGTIALSTPQSIGTGSSPTFAALTLGSTPLAGTSGGTDTATATVGDILYCGTTNTWSKLAKGTSGQYLQIGASIPAWATLAGGTVYAGRADRTTNQAIADVTNSVISFSSASYNTGATFWTGGSPTRLTIPVTGIYRISCTASWAGSAVGARQINIQLNGTPAEQLVLTTTGNISSFAHTGVISMSLTANDYLEFFVYQNSGGSLNVLGGSGYNTYMCVEKVN